MRRLAVALCASLWLACRFSAAPALPADPTRPQSVRFHDTIIAISFLDGGWIWLSCLDEAGQPRPLTEAPRRLHILPRPGREFVVTLRPGEAPHVLVGRVDAARLLAARRAESLEFRFLP